MARQREADRRGMIRRPPTSAVFLQYEPVEDGKCRWCGLQTSDFADDANPYLKRHWHSECLRRFQAIIDPAKMREFLIARDHERCERCNADCSIPRGFRPGSRMVTDAGYEFTQIIPIPSWHADHVVPLWKVAQLQPLEHIKFFEPENVQTLCDECHGIKTAQEAAERKHFNHLAGHRPKRKGRKMQSRGFDKRFTRTMRGEVKRRA